MPRRRRTEKKRRTPLGASAAYVLLKGHDWFGAFADDAARRAAWEEVRTFLLAEHIGRFPGTRPWAWWRYDRPTELRRRVGGTGTPQAGPPPWPEPGPYHGAPGEAFGHPTLYGPDYDEDDPPRYESEEDYLARHGLLSLDEQAALDEADEASPENGQGWTRDAVRELFGEPTVSRVRLEPKPWTPDDPDPDEPEPWQAA